MWLVLPMAALWQAAKERLYEQWATFVIFGLPALGMLSLAWLALKVMELRRKK